MDQITLLIAVLGSVLVALLPPALALAAYVGVLVWYPSYLTVQIGTIDLSVGRIVIGVLLLRCLASRRIRAGFRRNALDVWVLGSLVLGVAMYCLANPTSDSLENRGGYFVDTAFVYMCFRLVIRDRTTLVSFTKMVTVIVAVLALLGMAEAVSGQHYFARFGQYRRWRPDVKMKPGRWGFARACGPFGHSIMFGLTFAMFLPLAGILRRDKELWRSLAWVLAGAMILGALSSMSSGPWVMVVAVLFFMLLASRPNWLKPLFWGTLALMALVSIVSNRPFYHVLFSYANPLGGAGWHRARLIDAAIDTVGQWWLAGFGGQDPGWGRYVGMAWTDITNHYLLIAVQSGLVGLLAFCGMLVVAVRDLLRTVKTARDPWVVAVAWALFSGLAGLMVVFMSVSLFGQPVSLFYGFLGITASLIQWQRTLAPVTVRAVRRAGRGGRSKEVVLGWQSAGESRRARHV